jgi:hypothetical protein
VGSGLLISSASEAATIREALPIFRNDVCLRQLSWANDQVSFLSRLRRIGVSCFGRLYGPVIAAVDLGVILIAWKQEDRMHIAIREQSLAHDFAAVIDKEVRIFQNAGQK